MASYCTECGTLRGNGETFCTTCAARFPDAEDPRPEDSTSDPSGHGAGWYLALTVALAVVVAAGLVGANALFRQRGSASGPPDAGITFLTTPGDTTIPSPDPTELDTSPTLSEESTLPTFDPTTPTLPVGPTPSATSTPYAGNATVAVAAQASDHPSARAVVALLSKYFVSINARDYAGFRLLHTRAERAKLSPKQFSTGFRSTHDEQVLVQELGTAPDGRLLATVSFVSTQNSADGPDGQTCSRWTVGKFLQKEGTSLRIGKGLPGYSSYAAC
ncbi:MAG: hypothetical protein QOF10_6040 [Kribbellaceae bacterium]|jgi:hypothetical protein|nr:hypothetical protein [Kribbellaceae bacterium]